MKTNEKNISRRVPPRHVGRMVERVVGCKWSLTVVDLVQRGVRRPGAMERTVEGLTAKVLNDCLRLLVSYGVLEKRSFPEVPPRVEYHFTSFGRKFVETFEILDALEEKLARARRTKDGKVADRAACGDCIKPRTRFERHLFLCQCRCGTEQHDGQQIAQHRYLPYATVTAICCGTLLW